MTPKPRGLIATIAVCAFVALTVSAALAYAEDSPLRTYGDALATFEAGITGGGTILQHGGPFTGQPTGIVPTDSREDIRIYLNVNGREYCGSGWHIIMVFDGQDPSEWENREAMFDALNSTEIRFELDGVPLVTERTAIKNFGAAELFGVDQIYAFVVASLMPPGSLSPGRHTVRTYYSSPIAGDDSWAARFTILDC